MALGGESLGSKCFDNTCVLSRGAPDVFLNTILKKGNVIAKRFESDVKSGTSVTYNQKWKVDLDDVKSHSVTVQIRDSGA